MSFTEVFYESPSLYAIAFPPPAEAFIVRTVESADPADMEARVAAVLAEMTTLNVAIAAAYPNDLPDVLMTLADADLAGGGDGHEFVTTLFFSASSLNGVQEIIGSPGAFVPENFSFKFALAGEGEALQSEVNDAILRAIGAGADFDAIFQAVRGASKGTRFMYMLGGLGEGGGGGRLARTDTPSGFQAKLAAARASRDAALADKKK
jgi:hypothetical protein